MMNRIYVNGHFLHQRLTGVQRFAREVLAGFDRGGYAYEVLSTPAIYKSNKLTQQFWEQLLLPYSLEKRSVLWSPTDTGPVFLNNHVITVHDTAVFSHPQYFSAAYARWKQTLIPRLVKKAKKVITVSEFSKRTICEYLSVRPEKVQVVYNGVDNNRFKPASDAVVKGVLAKYGISAPYLLTLGSLDPRKNFKRLIEAWHRCVESQKVKGYSLIVAGGTGAAFNKQAITESAIVKLLGYVDDEDLPALYSGAEAFLLPSLFEGFGLPVIEAMACGTPVLTSNTTALEEVGGGAVVKVAPGDTDSISEGIMMLIDSPSLRDTLVSKGFARIKLFNWNEAAASVYRHLSAEY